MISLSVLSLIRTTAPNGLWFNSCNVAQRVFFHEFNQRDISYEIQLGSIDGIWGFGISVRVGTSGKSSGLWLGDFKFRSMEEALSLAIEEISEFILRNGSSVSKITFPSRLEHFHIKEPYRHLQDIIGHSIIGI